MDIYLLKKEKELPYDDKVKIYEEDITGGDKPQLHFLHKGKLTSYQNSDLFLEKDLGADDIYFHNGILLSKSEDRIDLYKYETVLELVTECEKFDFVKFGHFFPDKLGILNINQNNVFKFYALMDKMEFCPIWPFKTKNLNYAGLDIEVILDNLDKNSYKNVIVKSVFGVDFFKIDDGLKQVVRFDVLEDDKFFLASLGNGNFKNLVVLNSTGMFIYDFKENFEFDHFEPKFSELYFSTKFLNSVRFLDLDGDGIDEMFLNSYKGLNIYKYNIYNKKFKNVLKTLPVNERHNRLIYASRNIICTYGENFNIYKIKHEKEILNNKPQLVYKDNKMSSKIPEIRFKHEKEEMLLKHTLDYSSLFESVDVVTGKPKFELNIADFIGFKLYYDANNKENNVMSQGWYFMYNRVVLNHKNSIFEDDHKYYLIMKNVACELQKKNITSEFVNYQIEDLYFVRYYNKQEKWEMESKGVKFIYTPLEYESKNENWYGEDGSGIEIVTGWYLKQVVKQNHTTIFEYENKNIKKIYDENNKIEFFYETDTRARLKGYKLETITYTQNIEFSYFEDMFVGLKQNDEFFIKFNYEDTKLSKVLLPENVGIYYFYKLFGVYNKEIHINTTKLEHYNLNYINNMIISTYNENNKTIININDNEMNNIKNMTLEAKGFFNLNDDLFVLDSNVLRVFNSKFVETQFFEFSNLTKISATTDFLIYENGSLGIIEYNNTYIQKNLINRSDSYTISISDRIIGYYDDVNIVLTYKSGQNWLTKNIKNVPGFLSAINKTLSNFEFSSEYKNHIFEMFISKCLQIYNNLIMLYTWEFEKPRFKILINTYSLNNTYDIVDESSYVYFKDNIDDFVKDTYFDDNILNVKYIFDNKLKLKVIDYQGPEKDSLEKDKNKQIEENNKIRRKAWKIIEKLREDKVKVILDRAKEFYDVANEEQTKLVDEKVRQEKQKLNDNLEEARIKKFTEIDEHRSNVTIHFEKLRLKACEDMTIKLPKDYFILDKTKYMVYLVEEKIVSDNHRIFYNGNFVEKKIEKQKVANFKLDENYEIVLENTYKIRDKKYNQEIDLLVNDFVHININYPFYIVSNFNSDLRVVEFYENLEPKVYDYKNCTMLQSNFDVFAFKQNSIVYIRPQRLRRLVPNYVVEKYEVKYNNLNFSTGYRYDSPVPGEVLYYEKMHILPNNDEKYGYVELHNNTKKMYNKDGELLKTIIQNNTDDDDDKSNDDDNKNILFDKTGFLEISDFSPYNINKDEVFYFGFEDYEKNSKLKFEGEIINGFSLTGSKYLKNKYLEGVFKPEKNEYIVSAWVRTGVKFTIGDKTALMVVVVEDNNEIFGLPSQVVFKNRDWYYLEVLVDLNRANFICEIQNDHKAQLKIRVKISNCDVDHIRLVPKKSHIFIKTYKGGKVSEEILSNGLIKKYVYKNLLEIAKINEYNELEIFESKSKKSNLEIIPETGFYEDFELFNFGRTVFIDSDFWSVSPGRIDHFGSEYDILKFKKTHESHGISFNYNLENSSIKIGDLFIDENKINIKNLTIQNKPKGEIVMLKVNGKSFVWSNGKVIFEGYINFEPEIRIKGNAFLTHLFVFTNPAVHIRYLNSLGNKIQDLQLKDEKSVMVQEYLYNELNRLDIYTLPLIIHKENLLSYHDDFVLNKNPKSENSVWKINKIVGTAGEYNFSRIVFEDNPVGNKLAYGLPGLEYSILNPNSKRYSYENVPFFSKLFPECYFVTEKGEQVDKIKVYDARDNLRGLYIKSGNSIGHLSTFEYENGKVVKILPPLYHENAKTLLKIHNRLTDKELILQNLMGVHNKYHKDVLVEKKMPDCGTIKYVYDDVLKFVIYEDSITFIDYESGRIKSTGYLKTKNLNLDPNNTIIYQSFSYGDTENPIIRGNTKRVITYDKDTIIEEEIKTHKLHRKRIIINKNNVLEVNIKAKRNQKQIEYPVFINNKRFVLTYRYNRLGKLMTINNELINITYEYDYTGHVKTENNFNLNLTRIFHYESPGFINKISDRFLTEDIFYKNGSYGGLSYSDGTIVKTKFNAHWNNSSYGHSYTYGKYQELIKAKYFVNKIPKLLQPKSFMEIPGVNEILSVRIWNLLKDTFFIIEDKEFSDLNLIHGKKGKPITNHDGLTKDFVNILKDYKDLVPDIAKILTSHFLTELGQDKFDVDFYDIDPNGNFKKFYNGLKRYELIYKKYSNRISHVLTNNQQYIISHDKKGNVVKAEYKEIDKIVYNNVTNLVNEIHMKNQSLFFSYDSNGERVLKRVIKNDKLFKEVFYIRDKHGRPLVERCYFANLNDVLLTTYIYGAHGLVAFIRRDAIYGVITDHEGSIRLVYKDNEIISAYDYLPYGNLMKKYNIDPEGDIFYRFTGKEYDEETGLYNFHARLYDPVLGRFYQIDPKSQYFSPYKYAGNSPVSLIDPDGEFVFLAIGAAGIIGAYIAMSRANKSWNPVKWNFASKDTWVAAGVGFFFGSMTAVNVVGAASILAATGVPASTAVFVSVAMTGAGAIKKLLSNSNWDVPSTELAYEILTYNYKASKETLTTFKKIGLRGKIKQIIREEIKEVLLKVGKDVLKEILNDLELDYNDFADAFDDNQLVHVKKWGMMSPLNLITAKNDEFVDKTNKLTYKNIMKGIPINKRVKQINPINKDEYSILKKELRNILKHIKKNKRESKNQLIVSNQDLKIVNIIFEEMQDVFMFINSSNKTYSELYEDLEDKIKEMSILKKESDLSKLAEIEIMIKNAIENKIKKFKHSIDEDYVFQTEPYKVFTDVALKFLDLNKTSNYIKENLNNFLKQIWEESNFEKIFETIDTSKLNKTTHDIKTENNIFVSSYKNSEFPISDKDWISQIKRLEYKKEKRIKRDLSFDINGSLLLADVLLSKKYKRKSQTQDVQLSEQQSISYALNIIDVFENCLYKISPKVDFDLFELSKIIQKKVYSMHFDEILPLMDNLVFESNLTDFISEYERVRPKLEVKIHKLLFRNDNNVFKDLNIKATKPNFNYNVTANNQNPNLKLIAGKSKLID